MNKRIIAAIIIVLALVGLGSWYVSAHSTNLSLTPTPAPTVMATLTPTKQATSGASLNPAAHSFSYQGQDGKTALELLQAKYPDTIVSGTGASAFISATNGYTADTSKHEFWNFLVNGQSATVGAGSYTTKSTDVITWQIATY